MTTYQQVYAAISDALGGELMELVAPGAPTRPNKEPIYLYHPIHLEDVLRAIALTGGFISIALNASHTQKKAWAVLENSDDLL
jgi:hypothetical protein